MNDNRITHRASEFSTATAINAVQYSAEQAARALLDRMGVPNAREYRSGDLVELANLIATSGRIVVGDSPDLRDLAQHFNVAATTGRPLTLPASSCVLLLAAMTTGANKETESLTYSPHVERAAAPIEVAMPRALTDPEIVEVLASLGTDAEPSKYDWNPVLQVRTTVPGIRSIVDAYIKRAAPPKCPTCDTHEVELSLTCHNSSCASYATPVTTYRGWGTAPAAITPCVKPDWQACERISNLPEVDEAMRTFSHDSTADNATGVVSAILAAAGGAA